MTTSTRTVSLCVTELDPRRRSLIHYALAEAFVRVGLPLRIIHGEPREDDIVYGRAPARWRGRALAYDPRCYDPAVRFASVGSPPLWAPSGTTEGRVDLIGGLARLLTLADETQIPERERNARGIFPAAVLPFARGLVRAEPLVENHTLVLAEQLRALAPGLTSPSCLWPAGYRYAVLLTHDTDAVELGAPLEILFNGAKGILRCDALRLRMMWDGFAHKRDDPLFGFGDWADIERAADVRAAFFVFGRHKVRPEINDCRSTVFNRKIDWDLLRSLAADGWEFGLHPPIRAKYDVEEFILGKEILEARLGKPVYGLRHHYWALDWRQPHLTFRKHIRAGFRYDSSIAWKDDNGLRAGTCLPYRPFDPERQTALDIYELPTVIMDGNVMRQADDVETAVARALGIVDGVRRVGGVLNLDWHTEAAKGHYCFNNHPAVFKRILAELQAQAEAWFVTPWELVRYWHSRRQALCTEAVHVDSRSVIAADG